MAKYKDERIGYYKQLLMRAPATKRRSAFAGRFFVNRDACVIVPRSRQLTGARSWCDTPTK